MADSSPRRRKSQPKTRPTSAVADEEVGHHHGVGRHSQGESRREVEQPEAQCGGDIGHPEARRSAHPQSVQEEGEDGQKSPATQNLLHQGPVGSGGGHRPGTHPGELSQRRAVAETSKPQKARGRRQQPVSPPAPRPAPGETAVRPPALRPAARGRAVRRAPPGAPSKRPPGGQAGQYEHLDVTAGGGRRRAAGEVPPAKHPLQDAEQKRGGDEKAQSRQADECRPHPQGETLRRARPTLREAEEKP